MATFIKRGIILIISLFLVGIISLGAFILFVPNPIKGKRIIHTIVINKRETGAEIADLLESQGLIQSNVAFRLALRIMGTENKLQAGYYQIPNDSSTYEVIKLLQKGKLQSIDVTIPEGFTIYQIADRLAANHLVTKGAFLKEAKSFVPYTYMYGPKPVTYHVEGFLYPSTYSIPVNATPHDILVIMTKEMNKELSPEVRKEIAKKGLTIYQFVTLASIVEREALFDQDRPIIAGVFLKRLKINMPLQSCATIEYLLGKRKPILSVEDVKIQSPYNTYIHRGLPPGPISNPGKKSMEAVLHATNTDYLYFVADKEGHHHFSKTYEEHVKAIKEIYGNN